jgi:glucans biosynthesis protein
MESPSEPPAEAAPPAEVTPPAVPEGPFSYDWLVGEARRIAAEPFEAHDGDIPSVLADLNYDQYRDIRYKAERSLWRDTSPYEVQFHHLGSYYDRPVHVFDVSGGKTVPVPYDQSAFNMGKNRFEKPLPKGLGFAGLRVHYPLNDPEVLDELLSFLGASYFRALGRGTRYGLSSRGVAVDTGLPSGEEFPAFTRFYLERPKERGQPLRLYAMLDGPSLAGAFRFEVSPGQATTMDVTARLFMREDVQRLGLAPLTSMYDHGPNDPREALDYRPRVHDSQGLLMHTGQDEWVWRPLRNPGRLALSAFQDTAPKGFGLMQRVRRFDDYEDLEARYDLRPSLWVEPKGNWGRGSVTLLEIPTPDETHDNIVAFWTPATPAKAGQDVTLRYVLHWGLEGPNPPLATVRETRVGSGGLPGQRNQDGDMRKIVLDFTGGPIAELPPESEVKVVLEASGVETTTPVIQYNPVTGGRRVFFDLPAAGEKPAELRCRLTAADGAVLSETWSFQWSRL